MWKKLLSVFAAAMIAAVCLPMSAAAEETLYKGDTVMYIFTVGECPNIAGISVDAFYSPDHLSLNGEPEFLIGSQGLTNINNPGKLKWNTMLSGGRAFNGEDILIAKFTVLKKCSVDDIGLSYECIELFNHDLQLLDHSLITARIEIENTGTDDGSKTDTTSREEPNSPESDTSNNTDESDPGSSPSSRREASQASAPKPVVISTTDLTPSDDEDIDPTPSKSSSRTTTSRTTVSRAVSSTSSIVSSNVSSSASAKSDISSDASSKTASNVSSKTDTRSSSAAASVSRASSASASSYAPPVQTSSVASSKSPVNTTGRFAAALAIAIIAAAAVAIILARKLKTTEN